MNNHSRYGLVHNNNNNIHSTCWPTELLARTSKSKRIAARSQNSSKAKLETHWLPLPLLSKCVLIARQMSLRINEEQEPPNSPKIVSHSVYYIFSTAAPISSHPARRMPATPLYSIDKVWTEHSGLGIESARVNSILQRCSAVNVRSCKPGGIIP